MYVLLSALDVPTKSLPSESNLAASDPPSPNAMVLALGKKIPVSMSPAGLIDGYAVLPAATVVIPLLTIPVKPEPEPLKLVAVMIPVELTVPVTLPTKELAVTTVEDADIFAALTVIV